MRLLRLGLCCSLMLFALAACATGPFSPPPPSQVYVRQQLRYRLDPGEPHERGSFHGQTF